ncbi:Uncharacterised protein [BD1-7 clade bacterium]|uniref:DUF2846 domain-containing protein n=1 Tax=BD1-7 clade bacterium TaxID=2029982 RepID=A0A5S9Q9W9_9GAMM|nr:Uncharacterised protein [BD1-7 clade bacterium]
MFRYLNRITFLIFVIGLTGCAGLGNMKGVQFENEIEPDMVMVNIVRRSVYIGDGAKVEAWDGDEFIGTLESGKLLQYKTKPGEHTFMLYVQGAWGIAQGNLKPGKTYYLKFNLSGWGPTSLGVAKSNDPRIDEWKTMKTVVIDESSPKAIPEKYTEKARNILQRVQDGSIKATPITDMNAL